MKLWLWCAIAALALLIPGWMPFQGTDVADLQPAELIYVYSDGKQLVVQTDAGSMGIGKDPAAAFEDLQNSADASVFLETADYLLLTADTRSLTPELCDYLRPGCGVCLLDGEAELSDITDFLKTHEPGVSLQDDRAEEQTLPVLICREGRMHLVY